MSGIEKNPVLIMGESSSIGEATPLEQMSLLFGFAMRRSDTGLDE
jgi:hypothetical protein